MATGLIAYDRLSRSDPAAAQAVLAILARHPDAARFSRNLKGLSGPQRDRLAFAWMARWPDDIRPIKQWTRPEWHYQAKVVSGWAWFPFVFGQAETAWNQALVTARDPKAAPADRAIALCWLFHITGDIQQPLHVGHLMNGTWKTTDHLGTWGFVRPRAGDTPLELHQYWDHAADNPLLGDTASAQWVAARAEALPRLPRDGAARRPAAERYAIWQEESRLLAAGFVYASPQAGETHARTDAPVLGDGENARSRALATIRVRMGGERLAALLEGLR